MKKPQCLLTILIITLFYSTSVKSQTVIVSGQCIAGTIILNPIDSLDGKPVYENFGTVAGNEGTQVDVFWMPAPDNLWVLAFDGQPYFQTTCNLAQPPPTGGPCLWTPVTGQTCTGEAPLVINGTGTLAVKIISFTAHTKDKKVVINWQTASEINNRGFKIQRSADAATWTNIGFVNGSINSSTEKDYQFIDINPLRGKIFYRLVQVDIDNQPSYSSIVSLNILQQGFYSISNNPGHGRYTLHIEAGTEKFDFSVIDAGGRQIMSKNNNSPGDQTIDISNFSSGIYFLRIIKGTNLFTEKLVKF